jgi:hypothetical protein
MAGPSWPSWPGSARPAGAPGESGAALSCYAFRAMRDFLYRLVERLHDEARPLSRNQHFHVFAGNGKQALRIDRHLRDLEAQLSRMQARGERPRVRPLPGGGTQLVLRDPKVSVVRTATLSPEETAILRQHPAGAWALGDAGQGEPSAASGQG